MGKIASYKNIILLHIVVLIYGFTGVLGKLITIPSELLVWHRMLIASVAVGLFILFKKSSLLISKTGLWQTTLTGFIIAAHWVFFFESIKQSNVSITLATLSASSIFTAILEPIFFKRKLHSYEIFLGIIVILGLYFIFQFETDNSLGIILGIIAAFLASLFTVINGKLIKKYNSTRISFYELVGGLLAVTLYLLFSGKIDTIHFDLGLSNWVYLLILATICTAFAFVASVEVMKELKPFTVSLSINLEPVYGIILAFMFFGEEEKLSTGFYLGTLMILTAIFINVFIKRHQRRKARKQLQQS